MHQHPLGCLLNRWLPRSQPGSAQSSLRAGGPGRGTSAAGDCCSARSAAQVQWSRAQAWDHSLHGPWLSLGCYFLFTVGQVLHLPKPLLPVLKSETNDHKMYLIGLWREVDAVKHSVHLAQSLAYRKCSIKIKEQKWSCPEPHFSHKWARGLMAADLDN